MKTVAPWTFTMSSDPSVLIDTRAKGIVAMQVDWNCIMQVVKDGTVVAQHAFKPVDS